MDPEVTSGQEAGHQMPPKMVDPTFLLELSHCCVDSWESGHSIRPGIKQSFVGAPLNLFTYWILDHFVEVWGLVSAEIKPLSEENLAMEGLGRLRMLPSSGSVDILDVPKESPGADAAEFQVRTEPRGVGLKRGWHCFRLLKRCHPLSFLHVVAKQNNSLCLTSFEFLIDYFTFKCFKFTNIWDPRVKFERVVTIHIHRSELWIFQTIW